MTRTSHRPVGVCGTSGEYLPLALATFLGLLFAIVWAAVAAGRWVAGDPVPTNPFAAPVRLWSGDLTWPSPVATAVVVLLVGLVSTAAVFVLTRRVHRRGRTQVAAAGHSGGGRTARPPQTPLRSSWEDVSVDIWGPRRGKTSTRAIPAVLDAPGPVIATSNKRDLVDATRAAREASGQVYVFDPQHLATDPATSPLTGECHGSTHCPWSVRSPTPRR